MQVANTIFALANGVMLLTLLAKIVKLSNKM